MPPHEYMRGDWDGKGQISWHRHKILTIDSKCDHGGALPALQSNGQPGNPRYHQAAYSSSLYWKTWFPFFGLVCHCPAGVPVVPLHCWCTLYLVSATWPSSLHSATCVWEQCTYSVHYLRVGTTGRRKRFIRSNRHKPPFFCLLSFTANYWYNLSFHYILLSSSLGVLPAQKSPLFFYLPVDFSGAVYTRRKLKYCLFLFDSHLILMNVSSLTSGGYFQEDLSSFCLLAALTCVTQLPCNLSSPFLSCPGS